jgi:tRNA(adenine34) deaminase
MVDQSNDVRAMERALELARNCADSGDVPVGAVIVVDGVVVAEAGNRREAEQDPTAHAELVALRSAAAQRGSWRLDGATMYVTLEPCAMCAGALVHARIARLVIGAMDEKAGAVGSRYNLSQDPRLNHTFDVSVGLLGDQSAALLKEFFGQRR